MNTILLWLVNGIQPWRCPVCYTWDEYEWKWHGGQGCGGCDGTGIRWAWLRYVDRWLTVAPIRWKWWLGARFHRCPDCGRLDFVLGHEVGDHNLCMPF